MGWGGLGLSGWAVQGGWSRAGGGDAGEVRVGRGDHLWTHCVASLVVFGGSLAGFTLHEVLTHGCCRGLQEGTGGRWRGGAVGSRQEG